MFKPISALGVGVGAAFGQILGGWFASKMTRTPANKRIMYSGLIQIAVGFLLGFTVLKNRAPSIAFGLVGSGLVNLTAVGLTARADAMMDGSRFLTASEASQLPPPEANSERINSAATTVGGGTQSTTMALRRAG